MQQESETSRDQISSLEEQLQTERRRRDDVEMEVSKQKQVFYCLQPKVIERQEGKILAVFCQTWLL
jgi:hypothetical protein